MIKFKEHDGMLFKILEEPVPLTPDAEMPCLVQLIQDDSPMGRLNKRNYDESLNKIECATGYNKMLKMPFNNMPFAIEKFEIIGTFVEEGSEDWAWHMMQEGYKTKHCESPSQRFYAIRKGNNYCAFYDNEWKEVDINTRRIYCEFIEYAKAFPGYGWRILKEHEQPKPEPLLADAKEGWLVTNRAGHTSTIKYVDNNKGVLKYAYEISDGETIYVRENGMFNIINHNSNYDIVSTEPLATEKTKEWALQMMKLGKCVCHVKAPSIKYHRPTHYVKRVVRENCTDDMSDAVWMKGADSTGWQIYEEPKHEPIFTTGDKVTDGVIEGTIIHIEDAIADVCPSTDEYKIELRNLNHIPESPKQDDVEKPLRSMIAEAKAIGKNIRTYYQDIVFTPQALEACLNQGKFRWWNICNWELTTREQNYFPSISTSSDRPKEEQQHAKEPIANCENCKHVCTNSNIDHCHMYEPKPKSKKIIHGHIPADMHLKYFHLHEFKGGDWVEFIDAGERKSQGKYLSKAYDNAILVLDITHNMRCVVPTTKVIRKLDPSEVVIRIGCLSGTIGKSCEPACFLMWHSSPRMGFDYSIIKLSALDKQTRKLVEDLLEALEEKR